MRSMLALSAVLSMVAAAWAQSTPASASAPADPAAALPPNYWVEPMKQVHARFTGQPGTVAQIGDSITITMAFFTPLQGEVRNCPKDLEPALEWIRPYVQKRCWAGWKGPEWGNNGQMTSKWGRSNIEGWLTRMNPETAVIMFGTNDLGAGPRPPEYTDNMRFICQKCIDNGTIPILHTIPPVRGQAGNAARTAHVETFVAACRQVAAELKIPLIDYYKECLTRQPTEFAKLLGDEVHPSYPKEYQNDFSDEGLKNSGYTLRNYCVLKSLWEINTQVLAKVKSARKLASEAAWKGPVFKELPAVLAGAAAVAPKIDGKLDDACWQKATQLDFRLLDGDSGQPKCPTWAKLTATDQALYIAVHCAEPQMDKLKSQKRQRDENVWEDDSVEVFLRPGADPGRDYLHLILNADASLLDEYAGKKDYTGSFEVAADKGKDGWTVEIAIPFESLKLPDKTRQAGPWRLNVTRMRTVKDAGGWAEETALSPTHDTNSHVPAMFAYLWIEPLGGKLP